MYDAAIRCGTPRPDTCCRISGTQAPVSMDHWQWYLKNLGSHDAAGQCQVAHLLLLLISAAVSTLRPKATRGLGPSLRCVWYKPALGPAASAAALARAADLAADVSGGLLALVAALLLGPCAAAGDLLDGLAAGGGPKLGPGRRLGAAVGLRPAARLARLCQPGYVQLGDQMRNWLLATRVLPREARHQRQAQLFVQSTSSCTSSSHLPLLVLPLLQPTMVMPAESVTVVPEPAAAAAAAEAWAVWGGPGHPLRLMLCASLAWACQAACCCPAPPP
jgi:hypothetical protein